MTRAVGRGLLLLHNNARVGHAGNLMPGWNRDIRSRLGAGAVSADSTGLGGAVVTWDSGSVNSGAASGGACEQDTISVPQNRRTTARLTANQLRHCISGLPSGIEISVSCALPSLTDH